MRREVWGAQIFLGLSGAWVGPCNHALRFWFDCAQVDNILRRTDIFTEGMYQGDLACIETIKMFDQRLKTFVPNR